MLCPALQVAFALYACICYAESRPGFVGGSFWHRCPATSKQGILHDSLHCIAQCLAAELWNFEYCVSLHSLHIFFVQELRKSRGCTNYADNCVQQFHITSATILYVMQAVSNSLQELNVAITIPVMLAYVWTQHPVFVKDDLYELPKPLQRALLLCKFNV